MDLNRAGTPLLEIVSEPDMRRSDEARAYMEELRTVLRYINVCDGNLEEGSMRCDANISVMEKGAKEFGTRAEIKNVNSFRALQRAIEYEIDRQIDIVEEGGEVVQETRLWDDNEGVTKSMRGKEDAHDYRYFPEPDLMPLEISQSWVDEIKAKMPELPQAKRDRYVELGLTPYDANVIVEQMETALFFDEVIKLGTNVKMASNFLMGEVTAYLKENKLTINETKLTPGMLKDLIELIENKTITNNIAKSLIIKLVENGGNVKEIVEKEGMGAISDTGALNKIIEDIIKANPNQVAQYKAGKEKLFGFFVGQVMKQTQGRANPAVLNDLIKAALAK